MDLSLEGCLRGSVPSRHIVTRLYRPQTDGKEETFFRIWKKEFFGPNSFQDLSERKEQMGGFSFEYDHLRQHGGIKYMTPFDKLLIVTELVR
jgi:transposase InsO family protein